MLKVIWIARAAYGLRWRTGMRWRLCWQVAASIEEGCRSVGMSPAEAARDELSYWGG